MFISLPWPFIRTSANPAAAMTTIAPIETTTVAPTTSEMRTTLVTRPSLDHYSIPGVTPPSARVDPRLKLQEKSPVRLWHLWKYGIVLTSKMTQITSDVLSYYTWGPRKKSWGLQMTLISSIMRGVGRHSGLVDISTIRMIMGIGGLVPLPSDAIITPLTFRVKRRHFKGLLKQFDEAEDGKRELSGEWVVGRRTWHRLQNEWKANKRSKQHRKTERVVLYIHGGAYYLSSASAQRLISIPLAKYTDARVFALDYRLAPESQFPGPLHDVVSAYFRFMEDLHIPAENIIIAGDSAGGGLVLSMLMYLRDNSYPLPSCAILMCPWVDLTMSCESWDSNAEFDVVPMPLAADPMHPVSLYLGEKMEQYIAHPYASPLFGDFTGLPPMLIQSGDAEVLRDEITLLAHKATLAGVKVRHELYEDSVHIFHLYPFLEAASRAFMSMRDFVKETLPLVPHTLDPTTEKELEGEIENDSTLVVRGDGVETAAGMENVEDELQNSSETTSDSDEEIRKQQTKYSSWGRKHWSLTSFDEEDEENAVSRSLEPPIPIRTRGPSDASLSNSALHSAISLIIPQGPIHGTALRPHNRTRSAYHTHLRPHNLRLDSVPPYPHMAALRSMPPSPSIRRSLRTGSYTDLSNLVMNWTSEGPANETTMYKPPSKERH